MDIEKLFKSEIMPPKVDVVFKMLFGDKRNKRIVAAFLKAILKLDDKEFMEIEIVDPILKPEHSTDKLSIVDVNIKTVTGKIIHIEMQVADQKEMRDRATYYNARLLSTQLGEGQSYDKLRKTISIIIADFDMIPEIQDRCHNTFCLYEMNHGIKLSELVEINSLELPKIPLQADLTGDEKDWLDFLRAESKEEFEMVAERNSAVDEAYNQLQLISGTDENRYIYEARLKEWRDIDSRERLAVWKERTLIAKNLLQHNIDINVIVESAGLTIEQVEQLKASLA